MLIVVVALQRIGFSADESPDASGPAASGAGDASSEKTEEAKTDGDLDPAIKEIIEKFGLWEDEMSANQVKDISAKLIAAAGPDAEEKKINFILLDDDSVNAFALQDGHIFMFRGLVERAETDDQLASVMAHEMTHVLKGHHKRGQNAVTVIQLLGILAAIASEGQEPAIAGQMISAALVESYGRDAEVEADIGGSDLMIQAGYDPIAMLEFFTYMESIERRRPQLTGNYFTIHPYAEDRIENLRQHLRDEGIDVPDQLYRLHLALDLNCADVGDHFECSVYAGDYAIFTMASKSEEELMDRGYEVIDGLRDAFAAGLRDYEVRSRENRGVYYLEAKGAALLNVSLEDRKYLGNDPQAINNERLKNIKYVLWRYYIERRI